LSFLFPSTYSTKALISSAIMSFLGTSTLCPLTTRSVELEIRDLRAVLDIYAASSRC